MSRRLIETSIQTTIERPDKTMLPLQVTMMPVKNIREAPRNVRTHSKKQIKQISNSILAFGFLSPMLVDEHGTTIAGAGRLQAAIALGLKEVPVIRVTGLSDPLKRALAMADNKIAANAGWDVPR